MKVNGAPMQTIWMEEGKPEAVLTIDQRLLPHELKIVGLRTTEDVYFAIKDMLVRGAPLIGVTAAYGVYLAALEARAQSDFRKRVEAACERLLESRPTAVNLRWGIEEQLKVLNQQAQPDQAVSALLENAHRIRKLEIEIGAAIGKNGLSIVREIATRKNGRVDILTHCNAGWLCSVDWGTATAPMYAAHDEGVDVHIYVDETRPRNQGAALTAWELGQHGVNYTLVADNVGGHLMQNGLVDMVIVGTDRVTRNGDVANKIGTYLKALAARAHNVPFYVAAPSSSIDWQLNSGADIPIEERGGDELKFISGVDENGDVRRVLICPPDAPVANYGFDVTPANLVTGIITERGICRASEKELLSLFPDRRELAAK